MGIGMGYAIGAAVVVANQSLPSKAIAPSVSAAWKIETICRYELPIVTVVLQQWGYLSRRRR